MHADVPNANDGSRGDPIHPMHPMHHLLPSVVLVGLILSELLVLVLGRRQIPVGEAL